MDTITGRAQCHCALGSLSRSAAAFFFTDATKMATPTYDDSDVEREEEEAKRTVKNSTKQKTCAVQLRRNN